jgi:hypothetical protein
LVLVVLLLTRSKKYKEMREGTVQPGKRLLAASEKYGELGGDLIFCRGYNTPQ